MQSKLKKGRIHLHKNNFRQNNWTKVSAKQRFSEENNKIEIKTASHYFALNKMDGYTKIASFLPSHIFFLFKQIKRAEVIDEAIINKDGTQKKRTFPATM